MKESQEIHHTYEVLSNKQQKTTLLNCAEKEFINVCIKQLTESMGRLAHPSYEEAGFQACASRQHTTQPGHTTATVQLECVPRNCHQTLTNTSTKALLYLCWE